MRIFPKQIMDETTSYISSSEISRVRKHAEILFAEKKMLRDSLNLTGRFTERDQFELTEYRLLLWSYSTYARAKLKVHFYINKQGLTQLDVTVFPNSKYPTFFVLTPLLYIVIVFSFPAHFRNTVLYAIFFLLFILNSFLLLGLSTISKNNLRNKCVKLFELQRLN